MATCGIYKIQNKINHKIYIGQSINIQRRFNQHKNKKDNFYIHKAIQKEGVQNFIFSIIEKCDSTQLNKKEKYWIQFYDSLTPKGYNMIQGGTNGAGIANGKAVEQYSLQGELIQIYYSAQEASRQTGVQSSNITYCCNNHPRYKHAGGYLWKFQNSDKKIIPIKENIHSTKRKTIIQIETGKSFPSAMEAERQTKINHRHISEVCNGQRKTAGGYTWRYAEKQYLGGDICIWTK